MRSAGATPDNVWRGAIIEGCGFGDDTGRLGRVREVGGDGVEALSLGVQSTLLKSECQLSRHVNYRELTAM